MKRNPVSVVVEPADGPARCDCCAPAPAHPAPYVVNVYAWNEGKPRHVVHACARRLPSAIEGAWEVAASMRIEPRDHFATALASGVPVETCAEWCPGCDCNAYHPRMLER